MKMDVLFIDGVLPLNTQVSYLGYLYSIAAMIEQNGYEFRILNVGSLVDYSIEGLLGELELHEFKMVGVTTNADNIRFVYKVCKAIKKRFPKSLIILGGPEVSYSDIEVMRDCPCDIIIRKEGEFKTVAVLDYVNGKLESLEYVRGITYRRGDGKVIRNDDAVSFDINSIPVPKYEIVTNEKYWIRPKGVSETDFTKFLQLVKKAQGGFVLTGLGCPYKCSFCVEGIAEHKNTYYMSPAKVKETFERHIKVFNDNYIGIADDTFTSSPKRVKELCAVFNEIRERYYFYWYAEGRVDVLSKHLELIKIMHDAGLRRLQIGIESGNQNVLNVYNKHITVEQIISVLEEVSKFPKLEVVGNVIIGNPFESVDEFRMGVENLKRMFVASGCKLHITSSYLTPYHGTPIRINPNKFGIEIVVEDFELSSASGMDDITCKPKDLTVQDVMGLKRYVESNIASWNNESMYALNKKQIWERIDGTMTNYTPFGFTFGKMKSFKRYANMVKNRLVVSSDMIKSGSYDSVYPIRLWDIPITADGYVYNSIYGSEIFLDGYRALLWELATGNNSLVDICRIVNQSETVSYYDIKEFYDKMENELAILYKKYDLKERPKDS